MKKYLKMTTVLCLVMGGTSTLSRVEAVEVFWWRGESHISKPLNITPGQNLDSFINNTVKPAFRGTGIPPQIDLMSSKLTQYGARCYKIITNLEEIPPKGHLDIVPKGFRPTCS